MSWHVYDSDPTGPHGDIPRVIATMVPGQGLRRWWWEVIYISENDEAWRHDFRYDGGAFFLRNAIEGAQDAADTLWTRLMMLDGYEGDVDITDPDMSLVEAMNEVDPDWDQPAKDLTREEWDRLLRGDGFGDPTGQKEPGV